MPADHRDAAPAEAFPSSSLCLKLGLGGCALVLLLGLGALLYFVRWREQVQESGRETTRVGAEIVEAAWSARRSARPSFGIYVVSFAVQREPPWQSGAHHRLELHAKVDRASGFNGAGSDPYRLSALPVDPQRAGLVTLVRAQGSIVEGMGPLPIGPPQLLDLDPDRSPDPGDGAREGVEVQVDGKTYACSYRRSRVGPAWIETWTPQGWPIPIRATRTEGAQVHTYTATHAHKD